MARELVLQPDKLDVLQRLAERLRDTHCLFAQSPNFSNLFLLELSHWTEGMPMTIYREMLERFKLPDLPDPVSTVVIERTVQRDIDETGERGVTTLDTIGRIATLQLEGCHACLSCMEACPASAISIDTMTQPATISLSHALCNGVACRRCEPGCEPKVFHLTQFFQAVDETHRGEA
jgi:ferredoxin